MSLAVQLNGTVVEIPEHVRSSLNGFREWAADNDLPEKTRIDFFRGKVWVDMGGEQLYSHGMLKTQFAIVLGGFVEHHDLGCYWCNGILLTNEAAQLSGNPDGTFASHKSFDSGQVTQTEGVEGGFTELVGTPDMVLEVVSQSSIVKDKATLREAYWEAGIKEYWIADARGDRCEFQILKHGVRGYKEVRNVGGWLKSTVFRKSFKLTCGKNRRGDPAFQLRMK